MKYTIEDTTLTGIANAIRSKTGSTEPILTENMATEISGIETGGGSGGNAIFWDGQTYDTEIADVEVFLGYKLCWVSDVVITDFTGKRACRATPVNDRGEELAIISSPTSVGQLADGVAVAYYKDQNADDNWLVAISCVAGSYAVEGFGTVSVPKTGTYFYRRQITNTNYEYLAFAALETSTATISGVWQFNEELSTKEDYVEDLGDYVNFTSAGETYDSICVTYDGLTFALRYGDNEVYNNGWYGYGEYDLIDFGTEPQEVSQAFYNWLTTNAIEYVEPTATISGVWQLNEELDISLEEPIQNVNFTSNDYSFHRMYIYYDEMDECIVLKYEGTYEGEQWIDTVYGVNGDGTGWWYGMYGYGYYDLIDFGTEPQEVSQDFYNWLTANATEHVEPEVPMTTISGVWVFGDSITPGDMECGPFIANFTSNGSSYTKIDTDVDEEYGLDLQYVGETTDTVYAHGWTNKAYKTIDFGTEPQEVSQDCYNWLTSIATQK